MGVLSWLRQENQLKMMVLVIVFIAVFLDHMLLSVVVPIVPSYLYGSEILSSENDSGSIIGAHRNSSAVFMPHNSHDSNCSEAGTELGTVNIKVGLLLASKSTVQLIMNPFVGPLTDRFGYHLPMCAGFCIIFVATTLFAFSSGYFLLLLARSVQGVGGSCLSVAGMAMLADMYKDEEERGWAMGISFTGLALGLIAGAPFGSLMYQFVGKMSPFLVLAIIAMLGGGAIYFTTLIIAVIESALPLWMMKTMCASKWQLGIVFLPDSVSYLIASNIFGHLSQKHNKSWLFACIGMIMAGITTISFGFSKNFYHLLVQNAFIGFSVGVVDSSIMPLMGNLVDLRYQPVYGTVYAIADVAICLGFCVGPAVTGPIVASFGFPWLMTIVGTVDIVFAPLCILLLRPTTSEELLALPFLKHHLWKVNQMEV
ncbi:synaptic vesicular amine transporter-like [Cheilinus undulatus]|uniref:synaptic vesicular amine transporter-like n=1 Tax=Cheilinus undulatus TaxID=241271 RepID=UPI001BD20736|nr:synaptic vesicular amine transporter-like [Cheilinus undulatus]